MALRKVISGGQIGADIAGLRAAKAVGLETGGMCPAGWKTKRGSDPSLAEFNVECHASAAYPPRTEWNVAHSDGTIRLAWNFMSPGERCTLRFIKQYDTPHIDIRIDWDGRDIPTIDADPMNAAKWIQQEGIEVLNIAGNADEEIERTVQVFLFQVFVDFLLLRDFG